MSGAVGRRGRRSPEDGKLPGRDRAADQELFERELARLDLDAGAKPAGDESFDRSPERRARFDKRLARGEVEPGATLDLHGLDREAAMERLRRFISSVSVEVVLVIHGRGLGILEAATVAELDRHPRVAEHLPAPGDLGGQGARLVRLRH
jgi:DNA-nicking Smr family endonuclease